MKDISPILQSLGLLDSEIKTYLGALKSGPSTVIDLAKATGLSRQATYTAIQALTDRGLMSSVQRGKKSMYAAEAAEKLLSYAQRRQDDLHARVEELQAVIPELKLQSGGAQPAVRMYEGKEGLRALIDDFRTTGVTSALEMTDLDAMYSVLTPEDLAEMRKALAKSKVQIRGMYAGTPGKTDVLVNRTLLPKEYGGFATDIGVRGDRVAFATFKGKMYSVVIDSPEIAKAMRTLFELAFKGYEAIMQERKKR